MTNLELTDKEAQIKKAAEDLIAAAQAEGRTLTDKEEAEFRGLKSQLVEVRANRVALAERLKEVDNLPSVSPIAQPSKAEEVKPMKRFSLLSTINAIVNNRTLDADTEEVLKRGREMMIAGGQSYSGQIQMAVSTRALDGVLTAGNLFQANTHNGGKEAVPTDTLDILVGLRPNSVLAAAGATIMTGLTGNIDIPVYSGTTVGWGPEVGDAINGAGTFSSVTLSPKRLAAYVDVSKQFLIQTSDTAEALLRTDIVNAINSAVEQAVLGDAGSEYAPKVTFADGGEVGSWATFLKLVEGLETANFYQDFKAVLSPKAKSGLASLVKDGTQNGFIFDNNELGGYPALTTSNAGEAAFMGVWSELIVAQWGAVDIVVDPYTVAAQGKVRLVVNAYFDAALRRPNAITKFAVAYAG